MPVIATIVLVSALLLLVLESIGVKKGPAGSGAPDSKHATPEQSSGFWARTCFSWLATTFYLGYSKVISLGDLPELDADMESRVLHRDLAVAWDKCTSVTSKHSLLTTAGPLLTMRRPQTTARVAIVSSRLALGATFCPSWLLLFLGSA